MCRACPISLSWPRNQTCAPSSGRVKSELLDPEGIPPRFLKILTIYLVSELKGCQFGIIWVILCILLTLLECSKLNFRGFLETEVMLFYPVVTWIRTLNADLSFSWHLFFVGAKKNLCYLLKQRTIRKLLEKIKFYWHQGYLGHITKKNYGNISSAF